MALAPHKSQPPLAGGLPLLGNALNLRSDMTAFLVDHYQKLGSVFRIRILNRDYTILAGIEANEFLARQGMEMLNSRGFFQVFAGELDGGVFLPALDGHEHLHLRKVLRTGYARESLSPHMENAVTLARNTARSWQVGQRVQVVPAMQRLITSQLGIVLGGREPGDYFDDIRYYLRTLVDVTLLQTVPRFVLQMPRFKRAKARVIELMRQLIETHRAHGHDGDLVDTALSASDLSGAPYSEEDLVAIGIGAYVAGMDTLANTCSFMLYALLKHPAILAQVTAEVDSMLDQRIPTLNDLRGMAALSGAASETLRMFMIAPITLRTAAKTFDFCGYTIQEGTNVMIANGVTHFLPEFFPDPYTFRIDRESRERVPYSYTPYTLGAHTCLGAGIAESLLMLTIASLLYAARYRLDPVDFTAKIISTPAPNPGSNFYIRVLEQRHPEWLAS
jgi:cytochrome P450